MSALRIAVRLPLIGIHVVVGILLCIFALTPDRHRTGSTRQRGIVRWWLRTCTRLVDIHPAPDGLRPDTADPA